MRKLHGRIATIAVATAAIAAPILAQSLGKSNQAPPARPAGMAKTAMQGKAMRFATKARKAENSAPAGMTAAKTRFAAPLQAPEKVGAQIPTIYGSLIYSDQISDGSELVGLYEVPKNSVTKATEIISGPDATMGGVMANGKYWCNTMLDLTDFYYVFIYGYDLETGAQTDFIMGTDDNLARAMTYDSTTGKIYGIFYTEGLQSLQLGTIDYDGENMVATTTSIAPLAGNWNSLACDSQGQLYGISYTADISDGSLMVTGAALNKIDKETGAVTKVGDMEGYAPQYTSGCVIDPKTDRMYWNYNPADGTAYMCEVDLATGETTTLYRLAHNDEIVGMYIPQATAEAKAPGEPTDLDASFADNALDGTFSFKAPSHLFDGSDITGTMSITATINGEPLYTNESVTAGQEISVPVTVTEPGLYSFVVKAANEAGSGPEATLRNFWIGSDIPVAPKVTLTNRGGDMTISWTASSSSVNGGYLDYEGVTYSVTRYPGAVEVATGLKATTFSETVEIPSDHMETFYYEVTATFDGQTSAPGQSNPVSIGTIIPPYENDFSSASSLDAWTIENTNGDSETWAYDADEEGVTIMFGPAESDDWLISPPVRLEKGKAYYISFDVRGRSTTWHQLVELRYGRSAEGSAMTGVLSEPVKLVDQTFVTVGGLLVPDADGVYYIGLHDISEPDQLAVLADNFRVLEGVSVLAPGEAGDLKVTPDIDGGLTARISFTTPALDIAGEALTSLDKVEVYRGEELVKTFENPGIGVALEFDDTVAEKGLYVYKVIGYNAHGTGITAEVSNYIGGSLPKAPEATTVSGTPGSGNVTVTWQAVTEDVYGNPVNPATVRYKIYNALSETPEPIVTDYDGLSYTYAAVEEGSQNFVQCAVAAVTDAGESEAAVTNMIAVGTPYTEFDETFADGETHYNFGVMSIGEASWRMCTDATFADGIKSRNGDNGFLACRSGGPGTGADLYTGLVSLADIEKPGVVFYTYNIVDGEDDDNNELHVYAKAEDESEYTLLLEGEINDLCDGKPGWKRFALPLDAFAGKTVQVKFTAIDVLFMYTMLDDISITSLPGHDMAMLGLTADELVMAGSKFNATARVANYGTEPSGAFSVSLYAGDSATPVETKNFESLASGASLDVAFETTLSPFASGTVEYYAKVESTGDENADNDRSESVEITTMQSYLPGVTDLAGEYADASVKLTWSEPDIDSGIPTVTQDFEDGESFAARYGSWTFVDLDDTPVGQFSGINVPGITGGTTKGSFWVWDTDIAGTGNVTFDAHSGTHYLFSLYRVDDGEANDWAISPELQGCAQTVSFYAKSYASSASLAEKIEVYYSTGSLDPADFIKVEGAGADKVPNEWTLFTAELPEGAKHFAIRSCATGAFMLMVDDVTFSPAGATLDSSLLGFDVYRDGVKINDATVEDFEYIDMDVVADTRYVYNVVAVYDSGLSRPSNDVTVQTSGIDAVYGGVSVRALRGGIEITGADGMQATVSDMGGAVIFSGVASDRTFVRADAGVYVVKAGNAVRKVRVK